MHSKNISKKKLRITLHDCCAISNAVINFFPLHRSPNFGMLCRQILIFCLIVISINFRFVNGCASKKDTSPTNAQYGVKTSGSSSGLYFSGIKIQI